MARIEQKQNPIVRMANWYTRRSYGRDTGFSSGRYCALPDAVAQEAEATSA